MSKAIIYIEETNSMADVTFPSVPKVVSLLHYDDIDRTNGVLPVAGYPVICVTVRPKLEFIEDAVTYFVFNLLMIHLATHFICAGLNTNYSN